MELGHRSGGKVVQICPEPMTDCRFKLKTVYSSKGLFQKGTHLVKGDFRLTAIPRGKGAKLEAEPHRLIHNFPCIDLLSVFGRDLKKAHQHGVEKHLPLARIRYNISFSTSADSAMAIDCEIKKGAEVEVSK